MEVVLFLIIKMEIKVSSWKDRIVINIFNEYNCIISRDKAKQLLTDLEDEIQLSGDLINGTN